MASKSPGAKLVKRAPRGYLIASDDGALITVARSFRRTIH